MKEVYLRRPYMVAASVNYNAWNISVDHHAWNMPEIANKTLVKL